MTCYNLLLFSALLSFSREENGGLWSKDGCSWVEKSSNAESSQCYCNHTTNFGLLIQKHDIEVREN